MKADFDPSRPAVPIACPRLLVETKSGWISIAYWQPDPMKWDGPDEPCWAVFEPDDHYYSIYLDDDPPVRWRPLPAGPGGE